MKKFLLPVLWMMALQVSAQKSKFAFASQIQAGLLEGENGSTFQLQTINGVGYKTWSAGMGAGLDYYYTRSIPLFINVQKSFGKSIKAPFVYASGGYNFPWLRDKDEDWTTTEAKHGLYYDAGIGYQLPVCKTSALFFSAGYSEKGYSTKSYPSVVITVYPSPAPTPTTFDYSLRRISIKTGLRF